MKTLFLFFLTLSSPLYALMDDSLQFFRKDIVRIISDNTNTAIRVNIFDIKGKAKFRYAIDIISFEPPQRRSIHFEDNVFYEACYFMAKGDYLFFITSPFNDGAIIIIDTKTDEITKYFLDDFLRKNNLYTDYETDIIKPVIKNSEFKIWHKNGWNTLSKSVILLCEKELKGFIRIIPDKKTIIFESKEVKDIKKEYIKKLESQQEEKKEGAKEAEK